MNDRVGYKAPPEATRFQKGRSGNPRGRPKRKATFFDEANEVINLPVAAPGKGVSMSTAKAGLRSCARRALKGEKTAMTHMIRLCLAVSEEVHHDDTAEKAKAAELMERAAKILRVDVQVIRDMAFPPQTPEMIAAKAKAAKERERLIRQKEDELRRKYRDR